MKKFVLSLFALSLSFFGYSYALDVSCNYTFDWDSYEYIGDCSPSVIPLVAGDYVGTISNFEFNLPVCDEDYWGDCSEYPDPSDLCLHLDFLSPDGIDEGSYNWFGEGGTCGNDDYYDNPFDISIGIENGLADVVLGTNIFNKNLDVYNDYPVNSYSFDLSIPGYNIPSDDPDDPDDPVVPDDPDVPVVPDDPVVPDNGDSSDINSSLGSVIVGLFVTFSEIIPYFVYLSIGILIVTLGFYAVRWLVNWLNKKINNTFK